jgi:hypothetical protein
MKHLQVVSLLFIIAAFLSCKKDDPADTIIGTWKSSKVVSTGCTDPDENQTLTFTNGCYSEPTLGLELCVTVTFNENGSYSSVSKSTFFGSTDTETINGTYSIAGNKLTICETPSSCEVSDFTLNGNTVTINTKDTDTNCTTVLTMVK